MKFETDTWKLQCLWYLFFFKFSQHQYLVRSIRLQQAVLVVPLVMVSSLATTLRGIVSQMNTVQCVELVSLTKKQEFFV